MAMFIRSRARLFTDPFNEKVRERIFGFGCSGISTTTTTSNSGSEHDGDCNVSSSSSSTYSESPCLSLLVQNFLEDGDGEDAKEYGGGDLPVSVPEDAGESDAGFLASDTTTLIRDVIEPTAWSNADRFRTDLIGYVSKAADAFSLFRRNKSAFNRNVMAYLRQIGYDAGVCKTKWDATPGGNLAAGSYEFIDVVRPSPDPSSRYVIDLEFAGQFEIARATDGYRWLLGSLPRVFVGKSEDLKRIVKLMADEARRSMKINELSLPPWRKNRYMQLKWFGPYRRTVNQFHSTAAVSPPTSAAKCRSVGFLNSAQDGGGNPSVVAPPPNQTRTRYLI